MEKKLIILARMEQTGLRHTGRIVRRDGEYHEETEVCAKPVALVWSSDMRDMERGRAFADAEGYALYLLPDNEAALTIARERIAQRG